jgi:two-component system alkaline phosphatase synthesis response regulator PhoP/two-component system response regulator VicR
VGKHILVVDDEANVRRIVQVILQRAGYRVSLAVDGAEGMEKLREDRPDLVLLDVMMPHVDGFEMLHRMKADPETAGILVVMLTARALDQDIFEGERRGADYYLTKPFAPSELAKIVEEVLSGEAGAGASSS